MKTVFNFSLFILMLTSLQLSAQIKTPAPSPFAEMEQAFGLGTIEVEYSRPSMKGRDIFSTNGLVPYGKFWRTGANAATKISFSDDVTVEGKELAKGEYAILTKPSSSSWMVNFYPYESGNWGSYVEKDPTISVTVRPFALGFEVETFTIMIGNLTNNAGVLSFLWDDIYVPINVSTEIDETIMKNIDNVLSGPSASDYYSAGVYYFNSGKDLNKALEYVQKATKTGEPRFWQLRQEALILGKLGRVKEAVNVAKKSIELAKAAGNDDYVKLNEESIMMWKKK